MFFEEHFFLEFHNDAIKGKSRTNAPEQTAASRQDVCLQEKAREMVSIAHFTVSGENEAGVDLVLIQTFFLYHVNQVFRILTTNFKK